MSVAIMLGVDDVDGPAMAEARQRWFGWVEEEPALSVVDDLLGFRDWTRTAEPAATDLALRSLAKVGSESGGNDLAGITALTWALVPGAAMIAHDLQDLVANIDELVASHLWTSARIFEWARRRSTASSILRDTRRAVLADLGVGEWARRQDRTWAQTNCVEVVDLRQPHGDGFTGDDNPAAELLGLLTDAAHAGVIAAADRQLLIDLAVAADRAMAPTHRGRSGLMVTAASEEVADHWGMSARSVRRHASRSIDRLAAFAAGVRDDDGLSMTTLPEFLAMGA